MSAADSPCRLNAAISRAELAFELEDLPAAAVLFDELVAEPWAAAECEGRGVPVFYFAADPGIVGVFAVANAAPAPPPPPVEDGPKAIALLLHTSGTTSKPKLVPLAHENARRPPSPPREAPITRAAPRSRRARHQSRKRPASPRTTSALT